MENSRLVFVLNERCRAVKGVYEADHSVASTLFKTLDQDLAVGDLAVVESGTRHLMTVVRITEVDSVFDLRGSDPIKWVVQRIDTHAFDAVRKAEEAALAGVQSAELRAQKEELRNKLFKDREAKMGGLALASMGEDEPDLTEPPAPPAPGY